MSRGESDQARDGFASPLEIIDWGIPNWTDKQSYGETSKWTLSKWLWEFTRRREDYRTETLQFFELAKNLELADQRNRIDANAETKREWMALTGATYAAWQKHLNNWGYSFPLDPRKPDYTQEEMLRWPHKGVWHMRGSPTDKLIRSTMTPNPDELAIKINLDRPLAVQLALVKEAAQDAQKERHGRLLQRRRHPEKWIGFLRALDARASEAKLREMVAVFYRDGTLDRHALPEGGLGEPEASATQYLIVAGEELQSNFPF